ncbi:hypothetical protein [Streptomyces sp. NPDC006134]|uniref:hypothetical protein n=1 Tax=Streptomyces sp. NPDC006134 TaxID=3154467 RepID=UPI003408D8CD
MAAAALLTTVTITTATATAPAPAHATQSAPAHAPAPALTGTRTDLPASAPALAPDPAPAPAPACATPGDRDFPLATRIHGGPAVYGAGGGHGTWYLDLTNTTTRTCSGIHPVVVLVDEGRSLDPARLRLEFHDGTRFHPVRLAATDADELIGAFAADGDGFPGFTVGPGSTLTVTVRLTVVPGAVPDEVTANAAIVQRREDDGDWVGQSNDYRFRIESAGRPGEPPAGRSGHPSATPSAGSTAGPSTGLSTGPSAGPSAEQSVPALTPNLTPSLTPTAPDGRFPFVDQLAGTGLGRVLPALTTTALLVAAGATAVLLARRRR